MDLPYIEPEGDIDWNVPTEISSKIMPAPEEYLATPESGSNQASSQIQGSEEQYNLRPRTRIDYSALLVVSGIPIPLTYEEALASPFCAEWQSAKEDEIASLQNMGVYQSIEKKAK